MKLTAEQTEDLPFPIGCLVWREGETRETRIIKQGVVESVTFDHRSKSLIYKVVYTDMRKVEEVHEQNLTYGANCPVTIDSEAEGIILLPELSPSQSSKVLYTVMIFMMGCQARIEVGIDARRIKYRKVTNEMAAPKDPATTAVGYDRMEEPRSTNSGDRPITSKMVSVVPAGEVKVPSSITCDSVIENKTSKGGTDSTRKREHGDISSRAAVTPMTSHEVDSAHSMHDYTYERDRSRTNTNGTGRSINRCGHGDNAVSSTTHTLHKQDNRNSGSADDREILMKLPQWIQSNYRDQRDIFFHLIGTKFDKSEKRNVETVKRETNCIIDINYQGFPVPITITIKPRHVSLSSLQCLDDAREKMQDLLLDFLDVIDDAGAKGRLSYEVASSCSGPHRPIASTCNAVGWSGLNGSGFMSLVELPFICCYGAQTIFQTLENSQCISRLGCFIKVYGNDFGVPIKHCDPYALVCGSSWQDVDEAVKIVRDAMLMGQVDASANSLLPPKQLFRMSPNDVNSRSSSSGNLSAPFTATGSSSVDIIGSGSSGDIKEKNECDNTNLMLSIDKIRTGRDRRSTIMVRNIPNNYTRTMLLSIFAASGYGFEIDFLFFPSGDWNWNNRGYAFLNFVNYKDIIQFSAQYRDCEWRTNRSGDDITYARNQGKDALVRRYGDASVIHIEKKAKIEEGQVNEFQELAIQRDAGEPSVNGRRDSSSHWL